MGVRKVAFIGGRETDWSYAYSFKEASDMLLSHAIKKGWPDLVYFPIFFNYRHALELTLKELLRDLEKLLEDLNIEGGVSDREITNLPPIKSGGKTLYGSHSLGELANAVIPRIELAGKAISDPSDPMPRDIEDVIRELDKVDPNGEAFRYATARNGRVHFPAQKYEDLEEWENRLSALFYHLFGVGAWLDALESAQPGFP